MFVRAIPQAGEEIAPVRERDRFALTLKEDQ